VDPARIVDARVQAHHAAQVLAAFAHAHIAHRDDDSHRALTWDALDARFVSHETRDGVSVGLGLDPFELVTFLDREPADRLRLLGTTRNTARAWLATSVATIRGTEPQALEWPEYDLPEHALTQGRPFQPRPAALRELSAWFSAGQLLLEGLRAGEAQVSDEWTWPHHFDVAVLLTIARDEHGTATGTIGVGLSPGDEARSEPYLYVNLWPDPGSDCLGELDGPGVVNREGWSGYVLPATSLLKAAGTGPTPGDVEIEQQHEVARGFLAQALRLATTVLDPEEEPE